MADSQLFDSEMSSPTGAELVLSHFGKPDETVHYEPSGPDREFTVVDPIGGCDYINFSDETLYDKAWDSISNGRIPVIVKTVQHDGEYDYTSDYYMPIHRDVVRAIDRNDLTFVNIDESTGTRRKIVVHADNTNDQYVIPITLYVEYDITTAATIQDAIVNHRPVVCRFVSEGKTYVAPLITGISTQTPYEFRTIINESGIDYRIDIACSVDGWTLTKRRLDMLVLVYGTTGVDDLIRAAMNRIPVVCRINESARTIYAQVVAHSSTWLKFSAVWPRETYITIYDVTYDREHDTWSKREFTM